MQTMSAVQAAHILLLAKVRQSAVLLDATAGNGGDTLFLAENSSATARIFAFDIQQEALHHTYARLCAQGLERKVELILDNHAALDRYIDCGIDAAIFNLGYLPGADHELTTIWESTAEALEKTLQKLTLNGILVVTAYPGHAAGQIEQQNLEEYLMKLPKASFVAAKYQMINHAATAPVCYMVERVKDLF